MFSNTVQGKSDTCWFLLIKALLIKNNKKREAALKNEAGGDEKRVFFTWPICTVTVYLNLGCKLSLSFPSLLEVTEFFSWRARNYWNMRSRGAIPHSLLVFFPGLHNIFCVPHAEDFRNKNRLRVV